MDEDTLVAAARKGSPASFNELARRHADAAYNVAYRLLGSSGEATEATEEALLAAYRALPAWAGGSFGAWLLRCVVRACREWRGVVAGVGRGQPALPEPEAALTRLPWEERVAVVLADVQGLSYAEVASITGASLAAVRCRLHQGRGRLRREQGLSTDFGNGLDGLPCGETQARS